MRERLSPFLIGGAVLLAIGLMFWLVGSGDETARVKRSVVGIGLLGPVLEAEGIAVEASSPHRQPKVSDLAFRVLPIYDTALDWPRPDYATEAEAFWGTTLVDLDGDVVRDKIRALPTLVILPKWVNGVAGQEIAHESALIPLAEYPDLIGDLGMPGAEVIRFGADFRSDVKGMTLFQPQLFHSRLLPDNCEPDVNFPGGVLVARCHGAAPNETIYLLSDPDLLNNHGLGNGRNAEVTEALVRRILAPRKGRVYIDTEVGEQVDFGDSVDEAVHYERDLGSMARFFEPPFTILWAVGLLTMAVLAWRGAVQPGRRRAVTGPVEIGRSRLAAIGAKARLLRLSGKDGRMVAALVQSDIARLSQRAFGSDPARPIPESPFADARLARLHALWARRDRGEADRLATLITRLLAEAPGLSPRELGPLFETYRTELGKVSDDGDDHGRLSGDRRKAAR